MTGTACPSQGACAAGQLYGILTGFLGMLQCSHQHGSCLMPDLVFGAKWRFFVHSVNVEQHVHRLLA